MHAFKPQHQQSLGAPAQTAKSQLNSVNEKVTEKKKYTQQLINKHHSSVQSSQSAQSASAGILNFKKLAGQSSSSQLKSATAQVTPSTNAPMIIHGQQQAQAPTQMVQPIGPTQVSPGHSTITSNQKLLAGLNQLKQKRMLKQTMTTPN